MKKRILAVLLVLWVAFIFSMSSQNSTTSKNTSGGTIRAVLSIVPQFENQPEEVQDEVVDNLQYIARKSAHFLGYMMLGILVMSLLLQYDNLQHKALKSFIICVLYAISDEIHQLFVPGRAGQVKDVMIDSSGAILGIFIVLIIYIMRREPWKTDNK
ncbi:MAG: VanZ family protein [Terrisporobacter sp.]